MRSTAVDSAGHRLTEFQRRRRPECRTGRASAAVVTRIASARIRVLSPFDTDGTENSECPTARLNRMDHYGLARSTSGPGLRHRAQPRITPSARLAIGRAAGARRSLTYAALPTVAPVATSLSGISRSVFSARFFARFYRVPLPTLCRRPLFEIEPEVAGIGRCSRRTVGPKAKTTPPDRPQ